MLPQAEVENARRRAAAMLEEAGIVITPEEAAAIEVADLGLSDLERTGLEIVVYINTDAYCAKELVMFPRQTCPEHRHPPVAGGPGKTETFRVRAGAVYLYVPGEPSPEISARIPSGDEACYTVRHEIALTPGMQYTIGPDTLHWFQSGDDGAIVSEFSTTSRDDSDVFTDPRIRRTTEVS